MFDVCVIGHVTKDLVKTKNLEKTMPGGVGYYCSVALKNLGLNFSLVTKVADKDRGLLNALNNENVSIFYKESQETTVFENIYPEDIDFRIQNVRGIAQPFKIEDVKHISARVYHLGPLTNADISLEILKYLSPKAKISLDVQGFLRTIENNKVKGSDWDEKYEALPYINILKADENEAKILSGEDNVKNAALKLSAYGIDEVIITLASEGSLVYSKNTFYYIPAFPVKKIVDVTGCGDTYMAGYIYKRLKACDIDESGRFAAGMASLKLEKVGPFKGSEADIQNLLKFHSLY